MANPQSIVNRLIEIDKVLKPLEEEKEKLKVQLRQFGPSAYNGPGGFVTVSAPSISVKTGEQFVLNPDLFITLSLKQRKSLLDKGVVFVEEKWSRASAAKVEIKVVA